MGFWGTSVFLGNILGDFLSPFVFTVIGGSWHLLMGIIAGIFVLSGFLILFVTENKSEEDNQVELIQKADKSFIKAILLKGVIPCTLGYGLLKTVIYAINFWLPFYMEDYLRFDSLNIAVI